MPMLMVHDPGGEAEVKKSGTHPEVSEDLALLVAPTRCDAKYIFVARQVVLEELCEAPV